MCRMRCVPACGGRLTAGTVCEPSDVPNSRYFMSFSVTSRPMLACASSVERQVGCDVVINYLHPHRLGHVRDLRTDIAIADNAERLTAKLKAAFRLFEPFTAMRRGILVRNFAYQHYAQPDDKLGDRARVRI